MYACCLPNLLGFGNKNTHLVNCCFKFKFFFFSYTILIRYVFILPHQQQAIRELLQPLVFVPPGNMNVIEGFVFTPTALMLEHFLSCLLTPQLIYLLSIREKIKRTRCLNMLKIELEKLSLHRLFSCLFFNI